MKYITSSVIAVVVLFGVLTGHSSTAHAQAVGDTATSSPIAGLGGYSTPCFYLRQTHEWEQGYVCNDAEYSMSKFALDPTYRESFIGEWRQHIFVDIPTKYGWSLTKGSI